ncbi:MAG: hypothetical protein GX801_11150, partial [Fibrobacter sp.]|nr:hypothetical protein [Fibrobacter sp.]
MLRKIICFSLIAVFGVFAKPSVWLGEDGSSQIAYGTSGGYWYSFADEGAEVSPSPAMMNTTIKTNGYLPVSYIVGEKVNISATVGFDWYDNGEAEEKTPVDISSYTGLC